VLTLGCQARLRREVDRALDFFLWYASSTTAGPEIFMLAGPEAGAHQPSLLGDLTALAPICPDRLWPLRYTPTLWRPARQHHGPLLSIRTHFRCRHGWPVPASQGRTSDLGQVRRPGHGHNYLLDVTVRDTIDSRVPAGSATAVLQQLVNNSGWWALRSPSSQDVAHSPACVPPRNIACTCDC